MNNNEPVGEFDPNRSYSKRELEELTDVLLREDARSELCQDCGERGGKTGESRAIEQEAQDVEGNPLVLAFPEYECGSGHRWFAGEGKQRGIGGDNPILFEEHFQSRKRREIYTSLGTPDPSIVQGIYNRTHPKGRKVNSEEQRRKNGASYFR